MPVQDVHQPSGEKQTVIMGCYESKHVKQLYSVVPAKSTTRWSSYILDKGSEKHRPKASRSLAMTE